MKKLAQGSLALSRVLVVIGAAASLAGCGSSQSDAGTASGGGGATSIAGATSAGGAAGHVGSQSSGGAGTGGGLAGSGGGGNGGQVNVGGQAGQPSSAGNGSGASGGGAGTGQAGGIGTGGLAGSAGSAGSAGTGAQGGSGGGAGFHPCPSDGSPCKILPLGDSITWGIQYDGAYRVELFAKAVAAGKPITFTGSLSNGPSTVAQKSFPKNNEGHSGWTISTPNSASGSTPGVSGLIPSPALNTPPNIILLMIGTNDVYASSGQAQMPDRLGQLIDKITSAAPNALLVVAKITPLANSSWNATVNTYNSAIPNVVQLRAAAGKHVVLADMNTGFTPAMLSSDGIHPQHAGYDFMGDAWYEVIAPFLP